MKRLSTRQAQVRTLLVAGLSMAEISVKLGIKVSTVKTHIEALYKKSGFKSRRDLTQIELDETKLAIPLTRKQLQVLKGILAGKTYPQLAQEMGLSPRTVQSHRHTLYGKFGVDTRAALVAAVINHQSDSEETKP